jgi:acetyl-CoA synthetase
LLNGATTVIFEGVPSYPDYSRFGKLLKSTKTNFIRRQPRSELWQKKADYIQKFPLASLKVIGSVGEPINEEAWHWYDHVGDRCPVVGTLGGKQKLVEL